MEHSKKEEHPDGAVATPFARTYFHGTKADLKIGDFITLGSHSNFGQKKRVKYIFLSATCYMMDHLGIRLREKRKAQHTTRPLQAALK